MNQQCADALESMRKAVPLCHCITNYVSMDIMANTLLAIGASPIMAHEVDEVEDMVTICGATLVNIGTLSRRWIEAMTKAAKKAHELGKCWVLDPVGAGATPLRMQTCSELLKYHPTVIRGNASEIMALAGAISSGRGVDSTDSSAAALNAGKALAKEYKCVVGISGEVDYVTDGERVIEVHNGEQMCTLITAAGCSLTSIICAFLAIGISPMEATAFTFACFGIASEMAREKAKGPGSLRMELMDALHLMTKEDPLLYGIAGKRACNHFGMDLNTVLERIKGFSGVIGYVIVNKNAEIVHTSLDRDEAISLAAITIKLIGDGNEALHEFEEDNVEFVSIRSKKRDIMIVPGGDVISV